jgi:hypothetical protein
MRAMTSAARGPIVRSSAPRKHVHETFDGDGSPPLSRKRRRDLDAEDRGDDDALQAREDRLESHSSGGVAGLVRVQGGDRDGSIEHELRQRRLRIRSSTAEKVGSPWLAASAKN